MQLELRVSLPQPIFVRFLRNLYCSRNISSRLFWISLEELSNLCKLWCTHTRFIKHGPSLEQLFANLFGDFSTFLHSLGDLLTVDGFGVVRWLLIDVIFQCWIDRCSGWFVWFEHFFIIIIFIYLCLIQFLGLLILWLPLHLFIGHKLITLRTVYLTNVFSRLRQRGAIADGAGNIGQLPSEVKLSVHFGEYLHRLWLIINRII